MTLQFSNPAWLWLLALAPMTAWLGWRWLRGMNAVRRASAVVARAVLIALVTGMLAGATSVRSTDRLAVIAVVDVSGSVRDFFGVQSEPGPEARGGSALERVRAFLTTATADRGPDDLFGLVVFDGTSLAVASPTRVDVLDRPLDAAPTSEGTDIDAAMRLAAAMLPPDANGRIVLVSDGNQTRGDALAAARSLAAGRGAPPSVDVVPLRYRVRSEVVVEAVETPTQAPAGATVTARVRLRATAPAKGRLELLLGDEPVDLSPGVEGTGLALTLAAGERTVSVPVTLGPGRVHEFSAIFVPDSVAEGGVGSVASAGDTVAVNNRAESYTFSPGRGSVLLVDGVSRTDEAGGAVLAQTLRAAGMEVSVVAPEGIPGDLLRLEAYDLVMLANVPAEAVATGTQEALAAYVSQLGGGLVMIGGPDSLGAGGWKGTPVEPLLPVRLDLPEQMIVPPAAIIIVIDNSGSMNRSVMGSSRTQQEIANQGAALAIETLDKGDELGVTAFNSSYRRIIPLRTLEDPRAAADLVRGIQPDGGTNIPPPVADAFEQMKASRAAVRHIILLTDGISAEGRGRLPDIAREIAAEGIKLSTIAVGDAADTGTLKEMAELGGGEYYRVNDPNTLPRVFVRAVRVVRTPLIREGRFDPVVLGTASPVMAGVGSAPALTGLVLTQAREDATVTYTMMAPTGEPLLGYWNAGLGRVGVFTSDAHKWAAEWVAWPGYSRLWTQFARQIARPPSERGTELALSVEGDALRIRLDAADDAGTPLDLLDVAGKVYGPTGAPADIRLSQTAPGVYEASVPAAQGGGYVVTLTPRRGTKTLAPVVGGITRPPGEEYRRLESDDALLRQIAVATGGRVLELTAPTPGVLFDRQGLKPGSVRTPLWHGLMLWTLVVLLLDVGTRRVAWDRFIGSEYGTGLRQRARDAVRGRGRQAEGTLRSLRGRREQSTAAAPAAAEKALGTDAALEIIREQARRRAEARARAAAGGPKEAPVRDDAARAEPVSGAEVEGPGEQTSGLRQAKERARRRMEGREEDGS
jgi:uncharacterized membrane protein